MIDLNCAEWINPFRPEFLLGGGTTRVGGGTARVGDGTAQEIVVESHILMMKLLDICL